MSRTSHIVVLVLACFLFLIGFGSLLALALLQYNEKPGLIWIWAAGTAMFIAWAVNLWWNLRKYSVKISWFKND